MDLGERLIEAAHAIVLFLDAEGRIVRFNPYMEKISGYRLDEVRGKDWFNTFLPESDRARIRNVFLNAIGGSPTRGNVNRILPRDGTELIIEWYDKKLVDAKDRFVGLLAIGIDVTERYRSEEALRESHDELEKHIGERTADLEYTNRRLASEITERKRAEKALRERVRRRSAVARLGQIALESDDVSALMDEAVSLVAGVLGVKYCGIMEFLPNGSALLLRAGVGWKNGRVGGATVEAGPDSLMGRTLLSSEPLIVDDFHKKQQFAVPPLLLDHGVASGISTIIPCRDCPCGVLGVYSIRKGKFDKDSAGFVHLVANVLAAAIARARTGEALRESEEKYRTLVETANDAILVADAETGYILEANKKAGELLGMPVEEIVGMHQTELHPKEEAERYRRLFECEVEELRDVSEELFVCHKRGHKIPVTISASVTELGGRKVIQGIFRDITFHKQIEEALRASEGRLRDVVRDQERQLIVSDRLVSLGELVASIAHEFNNPLGIALGFTRELLTEVASSAPFYRPLKIIEEETDRCRKLMQHLLEFARPSGPDLRLIAPEAVVRRSMDLLSPQFRKKRITTGMEVQRDLPKIEADPQQLVQVLINLYFNSLEAMPGGGRLMVRMSAEPVAPSDDDGTDNFPQGKLIIAVADTGHGIDLHDRPKIFRPFFSTKKSKGMGLGLSICDGIMKAHNGTIEVESSPGRGTTFRLLFPASNEDR
jgi:PAS domain S-box-containing protein